MNFDLGLYATPFARCLQSLGDAYFNFGGLDADPGVFHEAHKAVCIEPGRFVRALLTAVQIAEPSPVGIPHFPFVDAGCGIGITLKLIGILRGMLTRNVTYEGIECRPKIAQFARWWTGAIVYDADIRAFDYAKYSIIYFNNPLKNSRTMDEFFSKLLDTARDGAVVISADWTWPKKFDAVCPELVCVDRMRIGKVGF
jgi:hypothetical protein